MGEPDTDSNPTGGGIETETTKWRLTAEGKMFRKARQRYPNGDIYDGEWLEGKRHGRGVYAYRSGDKFVGEFAHGMREGFGVFVGADGDINGLTVRGRRYEGEWKNGRMEGRGLFVHGDGNSYDGDFKDGKPHGRGVFTYANGDRFDGQFVRGKWSGKGTLKYGSGDAYEGELYAGRFHGYGTYSWADGGGSYVGTWHNGLKHGRGRRIFSNGNTYEGDFKDGKAEGEGTMSFSSGDVYVGDFEEDGYHGNGVITYAYGDRYEGQFMKGVPYGRGKYTYSDGGYYRGEYLALLDYYEHGVKFPNANGKRHGKGVRVWASGNKYEGDWADDKPHGKGVFTWSSGDKYVGQFLLGRKEGFGLCTFGDEDGSPYTCPMGVDHTNRGRDGSRMCSYEGCFQNDFRSGKGVFKCANGTQYVGEWFQDERCGHGKMDMIPELERGNPRRMYIGGVDGLYRPAEYEGQWVRKRGTVCGVREGKGEFVMSNGDRYRGEFTNGSLSGTGEVIFVSGKCRKCVFKDNGIVKYLSHEEATADAALAYMMELADR